MKNTHDGISSTVTLEAVLERMKGDPKIKIAQALQEAVAACHAQKKNGSVTIKVNLEPVDGGRIWVGLDVTSKIPVEKTPSTLLYSDDSGQLLTRDPNQQDLPGV